jgi:hypothetical protein
MAERLPIEVYDRILAYIVLESRLYTNPSDEDKASYKPFHQRHAAVVAKDLAACSLVCKAWNATALQKLYRVVKSVNDKHIRSLLPYLRLRPDLAQNVRLLIVNSTKPGPSITSLVALLRNLDTYDCRPWFESSTDVGLPTATNTRLRNLKICGSTRPVPLREHPLLNLPHSIRRLTLHRILLLRTIAFNLPLLQELHVDGPSLDAVEGHTFKACHANTHVFLQRTTSNHLRALFSSIGHQITYLNSFDPMGMNPFNGLRDSHLLPNLSHLEIQGNIPMTNYFSLPSSTKIFTWLAVNNYGELSHFLLLLQKPKPCFLPNLVAFPRVYYVAEDPRDSHEDLRVYIEAAWRALRDRDLPLLRDHQTNSGISLFEWYQDRIFQPCSPAVSGKAIGIDV